MHTKSELESMTPEQLVELGLSIGAQMSNDKMALIYNIIDKESTMPRQEKPKRGRPKKQKIETPSLFPESEVKEEATIEKKAPKKENETPPAKAANFGFHRREYRGREPSVRSVEMPCSARGGG